MTYLSFKLDKNRPICPQIEEVICVQIANGSLTPDRKLASVREIAVSAGINPNTVQKAFESLERDGLIYSIRGSGWYAADSKERAQDIVNKLIENNTEKYFEQMNLLGLSTEQTKNFIKEWNK